MSWFAIVCRMYCMHNAHCTPIRVYRTVMNPFDSNLIWLSKCLDVFRTHSLTLFILFHFLSVHFQFSFPFNCDEHELAIIHNSLQTIRIRIRTGCVVWNKIINRIIFMQIFVIIVRNTWEICRLCRITKMLAIIRAIWMTKRNGARWTCLSNNLFTFIVFHL